MKYIFKNLQNVSHEKSLKIPKGYSKTIIRRRSYNITAKETKGSVEG
jgi:hypothetical protein